MSVRSPSGTTESAKSFPSLMRSTIGTAFAGGDADGGRIESDLLNPAREHRITLGAMRHGENKQAAGNSTKGFAERLFDMFRMCHPAFCSRPSAGVLRLGHVGDDGV